MPDFEKTVPLFSGKVPDLKEIVPESKEIVPGECQNSTGLVPNRTARSAETLRPEGASPPMPNTHITDIDLFVRENINDIMIFIRSKCEEKGITHDELMNVTKVAHTSFYRLWKAGRPADELTEEDKKPFRPNADHVCRMCLALGVSLDEFQRTPTAESKVFLPALPENSHEEIMDGLWGEISAQRDTITALEEKNSQLKDKIAALEEKNENLAKVAFSREDDIRSNIMRINRLADAMIERHDQLYQMNISHNERVDKLTSALMELQNEMIRLLREKQVK